MKKNVIACSKQWFLENEKSKLKGKFIIIKTKKKLNYNFLKKIKPNYIFFPHWSYYIPDKIYKNFKCIIFHAAPLPNGRGGSPIQNLILRGYKKTDVCALKANKKIDAGDIYCREQVLLNGNLQQIFKRISRKILKMINIISKKNLKASKQIGKVTMFKRLKPTDSDISKIKGLKNIYDKIRSLDHPDYPRAFIKFKNIKIEFSNAKIKNKSLTCNVNFTKI